MISMVPKHLMTQDLIDFCKEERIDHLIFPASASQCPLDANELDPIAPAPTHALVAQVLAICIDSERLPLLIHCTNGAHITGLIIALLRRLQNFSADYYFEEYTRFTKLHEMEEDERQFISRFFTEITLPIIIPSWLWGGERLSRHPTIPLFGAALSVGLLPEDIEKEKDFAPDMMPSISPSANDFNRKTGEPAHHTTNHILNRLDSQLSAAVTSMFPSSDKDANQDLRGMVLEEPSSVLRRRTTG